MRERVPLVVLVAAGLSLAASPVSQVIGDSRVLLHQSQLGPGALTVSKLDGGLTGYYWDLGARAGELRPHARKVVMLGLGGGEMLHAARRTLPHAELIGVDDDPKMIRAAVKEFHVKAFGVRAVEADAFVYVKQLRDVDVLIVDLFNGDVMPAPELQRAFWTDCRRALAPRGIVLVNVYPAHLVTQVVQLLTLEGMGILDDPEVHGSTVLIATPAAEPL